MNVLLPEDKENELAVMKAVLKYVSSELHILKGMNFVHNPDEFAIFDFDGYFLDIQRCKLDVKVLDCGKNRWEKNMFSMEKYNDYLEHHRELQYFMVYYYPNSQCIRIYDLDKSEITLGHANIFHKRKKENRYDPVAYLRLGGAIVELDGITI